MISSLANAAVKRIVLLQSKEKLRRDEGVFITEGVRMFTEIPRDRLEEVYVTEDFTDHASQTIRDMLTCTGYELVSDEVMKKMSDTQTPQGVLCTVRAYSYTIEEIMEKGDLFMMLDGLQDPGNLGTIFRTAEAAGACGIIMSRNTVSIYNPKSVRSTMGTLFRMPFAYSDDLSASIRYMTDAGIKVYAATPDKSEDYSKLDLTGRCAFVIGNEGAGVSKSVLDACDRRISIPMEGETESLNAAVSAAILLYESHRQRS